MIYPNNVNNLIANKMVIIKKHITSRGNKLEFATFNYPGYPENSITVIDTSCQIERTYTIGSNEILSFEDYNVDNHKERTKITSFEQVISAWINEEIHF